MNIQISDILTVLPDCAQTRTVCISNGKIVSIDSSSDTIPQDFMPDKTISGSGKMLMPGLVNAHTHVGMTILRNCADDLLFDEWLFGRILPLEDKMTADDTYWSSMLGIMELISTGSTSFIDMYMYVDQIARAAHDSGIRAALSRGLINSRDDPNVGQSRLKEALAAVKNWESHEKIKIMLAPHAPYTCCDGYQREVAQEAKRQDLWLKTHLAEGPVETETIFEQYGCTPTELYAQTGILTDRTLVAHCVQVTDSDIKLLADLGTHVVTNPASNLKLANGVAPVPKMQKAGINVALGTDSAASNNTLNMFRELNLLCLIHKGVTRDPLAVTAIDGLSMATVNGAKAMGRDDLGEIKVGNVADLIILDLDSPNMQPANCPQTSLAYSTNGSEVETVIVGGHVLMENKEFLTIDKEKVLFETSKICERIGTK